ncbi:hypothetical protein [Arthrobacter sp. zg-Y769]|uniref:hypothetical protein n=1 Tax=Arthrobacter sp. zg-Y769 TaxID=2894191 RepID=UPI001E650BAA|nr:hypothetical protein [Arthrobacter sp. zg-Y769]MCC9205170.1 hypothetical protein [Arthrobacter sp. zg-Y769]
MARKRFDVEIPDGQHLGFSRDTDGAYRAHLFDDETNDLVGHAELFEQQGEETQSPSVEYIYMADSRPTKGHELTDEELDETVEALINLAVIAAMLAVKAAPHVAGWWRVTALPALKSASGTAMSAVKSANQNTIRSIRSKSGAALLAVKSARTKSGDAPEGEEAVISGATVPVNEPKKSGSSTQLETAFRDYRSRMGSAEARERFVAALVARAFSDQQMRTLRDARIEADGVPHGLEAAMKGLTPQHLGETISLMLEKNPSLLERQSISELRAILGGSRTSEGVSLRIERPRTAEGQVEA